MKEKFIFQDMLLKIKLLIEKLYQIIKNNIIILNNYLIFFVKK